MKRRVLFKHRNGLIIIKYIYNMKCKKKLKKNDLDEKNIHNIIYRRQVSLDEMGI